MKNDVRRWSENETEKYMRMIWSISINIYTIRFESIRSIDLYTPNSQWIKCKQSTLRDLKL